MILQRLVRLNSKNTYALTLKNNGFSSNVSDWKHRIKNVTVNKEIS